MISKRFLPVVSRVPPPPAGAGAALPTIGIPSVALNGLLLVINCSSLLLAAPCLSRPDRSHLSLGSHLFDSIVRVSVSLLTPVDRLQLCLKNGNKIASERTAGPQSRTMHASVFSSYPKRNTTWRFPPCLFVLTLRPPRTHRVNERAATNVCRLYRAIPYFLVIGLAHKLTFGILSRSLYSFRTYHILSIISRGWYFT